MVQPRKNAFGLDPATPPMEARTASTLPEQDGGWQYEPKWDGFRCLAFKGGGEVELRAKSGKSLTRYFPEVADLLAKVPAGQFVVDGELVIYEAGRLSFDALQMRLHPAESRIRKLSVSTPAQFIGFDILIDSEGGRVLREPLLVRRPKLQALFDQIAVPGKLVMSRFTRDRKEAERWLSNAAHAETDGVIAKRLDEPYLTGERAMIKVKRLRTADCVIGGFRYGSRERLVGSLLLGLYDEDDKLNHVGFTSTIRADEKPALTKRLEAMRDPPGFDGRAPGGPSRWSTERSGEWEPVRPELVVEVQYDHVTGDRFRHGTKLLRWRPDKAPSQCTFEQLVG